MIIRLSYGYYTELTCKHDCAMLESHFIQLDLCRQIYYNFAITTQDSFVTDALISTVFDENVH